MFDWKRIKLVTAREVRTRTSTKSFRWSMAVQILVVALIAMSPVIIAKFTGGDDGPTTETIVVADESDFASAEMFSTALDILAADSDTEYEVTAIDSADAARAAVDNDDADAGVVVTRGEEGLEFTIITSSGEAESSLAQMLVSSSNSIALSDQIEQSGLSAEEAERTFAVPELTVTAADPEASSAAAEDDDGLDEVVKTIVAYVGTILIFLFIMIYGQWVAQGVVEEKSSRIMEIMINAATPRDLLAGKVLGIMASALIQFVPMLLTVGVVASLNPQIGSLLGVPEEDLFSFDIAAIAWSSAGWFLLYFILGYLLFGAMYAGIGSLVSRQEEVSTVVAPMTTVMMVGYFAALMSMSNPDGLLARIFFIFPGTSPFVALLRLISGNPMWWEIALSIGLMIVAIVIAVVFAARLYRVGVLMYGQPPKITEVFKLGNAEGVSR